MQDVLIDQRLPLGLRHLADGRELGQRVEVRTQPVRRRIGRLVQKVTDQRIDEHVRRMRFQRFEVDTSEAAQRQAHPLHVERVACARERREECGHDLLDALHLDALEPHLMIPLAEGLVRGGHVPTQGLLALDKGLLQRRGCRVGQVLPEQLEREPRALLGEAGPTPRHRDGAARLVLRRELDHARLPRRQGRRTQGRQHPLGAQVEWHDRLGPWARAWRRARLGGDARVDVRECCEERRLVHRSRDDESYVIRAIILRVVAAHLRVRERAQVFQLATCLGRQAAGRIEQVEDGAVDERRGRVLAPLHLAVHDALVFALARDVMHLS